MVHIAESKTGPWSTIGMPAIRFASRSAYISWIHTAITLLYSIHAMGIHTGQINVSTEVCVVIRAYWGHGRASQQGLYQLITSMQRQSNPKYVLESEHKSVCSMPHTASCSFHKHICAHCINFAPRGMLHILHNSAETLHRISSPAQTCIDKVLCILQMGSCCHGLGQSTLLRPASHSARSGR